jgi:hypothetical protein
VLPLARIVACVRNPFDTIASWKASFRHLREADVSGIPVGHLHDPHLSDLQKASLRTIAQRTNLAERRALWWRHLAELLLNQAGCALIVRYSDLLRRPAEVVDHILQGFQPRRLLEPLTPASPRDRRSVLDDEDKQAIRAICGQAAAELGVANDWCL